MNENERIYRGKAVLNSYSLFCESRKHLFEIYTCVKKGSYINNFNLLTIYINSYIYYSCNMFIIR